MFQQVEIAYDNEECQQGEDNEKLHRLGVSVAVVLFFCLAKDKRLIGITESLCYHCHYHGYLRGGTIDAQLLVGITTFIYIGEQYLVSGLIQYSCYSQNKYWPTV